LDRRPGGVQPVLFPLRARRRLARTRWLLAPVPAGLQVSEQRVLRAHAGRRIVGARAAGEEPDRQRRARTVRFPRLLLLRVDKSAEHDCGGLVGQAESDRPPTSTWLLLGAGRSRPPLRRVPTPPRLRGVPSPPRLPPSPKPATQSPRPIGAGQSLVRVFQRRLRYGAFTRSG